MSNPDVSTKNYNFDNLNLLNNNSLDLSKQQINKSGRETTVISFLRFDSFSYATSKDYARSTQRSRHNSNTTSNPRKSVVAQGIGTAVTLVALVLAQAIPFANLLVDGLVAASLIGSSASVGSIATELLSYISLDNSLLINYARCATHD